MSKWYRHNRQLCNFTWAAKAPTAECRTYRQVNSQRRCSFWLDDCIQPYRPGQLVFLCLICRVKALSVLSFHTVTLFRLSVKMWKPFICPLCLSSWLLPHSRGKLALSGDTASLVYNSSHRKVCSRLNIHTRTLLTLTQLQPPNSFCLRDQSVAFSARR